MRALAVSSSLLLVFAAGCGGNAAPAKNEPSVTAAGAIAEYDKDGDGQLGPGEIDAAHAIKSALVQIDSDKNGTVTVDELVQRFDSLRNGASLISVSVTVKGPRGPLVGAQVTLSPEIYMGAGWPTYVGTTVDNGFCQLTVDDKPVELLPAGHYQAHVVHAASGTDKTLGVEISDQIGNRVLLSL